MAGIERTDFHFPGQVGGREEGKVRDTYTISHPEGDLIVAVTTDRVSAYDYVLPQPIPHKGQVLNQMSTAFLSATEDIAPNWFLSSPDPNIMVGRKAKPFSVEMIVRGAMLGSAWKDYNQNGVRSISGTTLPEGLREFQLFGTPLVTPTTKAEQGDHDEPITPAEIIEQGRATAGQYEEMAALSLDLFARGQEMATARGLYLGDTKFEFGTLPDGQIILIDEVLTPDSSRYFPWDEYDWYLTHGGGRRPEQLSKEFLREWLKEQGFTGAPGQTVPDLPPNLIAEVSTRYIELYEKMLQKTFKPFAYGDGAERLQYMEAVTGDRLHTIDNLLENRKKK